MNRGTKKVSTTDFIYYKIKKNIVEFTYEPGQQLVEAILASEFKVSRTPLRHALYRLELEGLLIKHTNGRISVAPMSIQEATKIFRVREVIEGLIAREATINIAESKEFDLIIHRLEDIMFLMRNAAETNRYADMVTYGSDFHATLNEYSNNYIAVETLQQINDRLSRYRRLGAYRDPEYPSITAVKEHEQILIFISKKDELSAESTMRAHIQRSLKTAVAAISYLSL